MRPNPLKGEVKITKHSSFRKLARAMRRNKVPPERLVIIENAMKSAQKRKEKYRRVGQ